MLLFAMQSENILLCAIFFFSLVILFDFFVRFGSSMFDRNLTNYVRGSGFLGMFGSSMFVLWVMKSGTFEVRYFSVSSTINLYEYANELEFAKF